MKTYFRGNTSCIASENGAQQAEKNRCLGMLTVFRKTLIGAQYEKEIQLLDKTHFAPAFSVV